MTSRAYLVQISVEGEARPQAPPWYRQWTDYKNLTLTWKNIGAFYNPKPPAGSEIREKYK